MNFPHPKNLSMEFPHIIKQLDILWGSQEGRDYLVGLSSQDRDEPRQGFPFRVMHEIGYLLEFHDYHYPKFNPHRDDPWGGLGL